MGRGSKLFKFESAGAHHRPSAACDCVVYDRADLQTLPKVAPCVIP
jgi:hypothetical protein